MADSGTYTPETIARRLEMARALLGESQKPKPIRSWIEGLADVGAVGINAYNVGKLEREDQEGQGRATRAIAELLNGSGGTTAAPAPSPSPASFGDAIANVESGGKYDALGPVTKAGDRAYGKYQVMGANIPEWTRQHYGQELTPDDFLKNPQAQDAVFKGQSGQYLNKYGPEGAAKAWFAGERGMNDPTRRDQLGTTVQAYADKVTGAMRPQPQGIVAPQSGGVRERIAALLNSSDPYVRRAAQQFVPTLVAQDLKPREYGFQTLPDGTIIRTDSRGGNVQPIYQAPSKPQWGVIGEDQFGNKQYGWIDPFQKSVTPVGGPAPQPSSPPAGGGAPPGPASVAAPTIAGPGGQPIPIPAGVDPKEFRKQVTHATADAATGKKTEVQANSEQFANRMEDAERNLSRVEPIIAQGGLGVAKDRILRGMTEGTYNPIPRGTTAWGVSKEYEQFEQAKSQFITALLRRESGAAISATEFDRYEKEFFPQMGDSAEVIAQKKQARRTALEGMRKGAGPGYQPAIAPSGGPAPPPGFVVQ